MSAGRGRLEIGTYGDISTTRTGAGTFRAEARFRDWDGEVRKVTAVGPAATVAKAALREKLARRSTATGFGTTLSPESTVAQLAVAWLEDVRLRTDLAEGTKDLYEREVNSLILPHLKSLRLREVTVGRMDQFIKRLRLRPAHPPLRLDAVQLCAAPRRDRRQPRSRSHQDRRAQAQAEGAEL